MICPFCGNNATSVTNSRPKATYSSVWRRRKCNNCKVVYSTTEEPKLHLGLVRKRSGNSEEFSRDKLLLSISKTTPDVIIASELTNTIIRQLNKPDPTTRDIHAIVITTLERFDNNLANRYRSFSNY